ncbi:MAG: hypothetical protein BGP05_21935 [Rhizobiales bacterium 62-47]|nr:DUF3102 domain-containing protein [Hyphomicrobiales bacterium]OJY10332.1 MAG: hypothetical protein BGP05_21935 [Rhizobiales bacterium 62-47]
MNQQTTLALVPDTVTFNYAALDREKEVAARAAASLIKALMQRAAGDIIEIGKQLHEQKEALPRGSFIPWIEAEFSMSTRSAQMYMRIAEKLGDKYATVAHLGVRALNELASIDGPEVVAEVERRIAAGEIPTAADIRRMKEEAEAAKAEAAELEQAVSNAEKEAEELTLKVEKIEEENQSLKDHALDQAEAKADRKYRALIKDLKAKIFELDAALKKQAPAENVAADAPAAATSNVVSLVPRETTSAGDQPSGNETVTETDALGGNAPDVDASDPAVGARVIHDALSNIDQSTTTPAVFWTIFGTPASKASAAQWLRKAIPLLTQLEKEMPL